MDVINPDDVLSALYTRLNGDTTFRGMVNSIDKGPKRQNPPAGQDRLSNPSVTVHLLTNPMDAETDTMYATATVNVYVDDVTTGQADVKTLGELGARVKYIFNRAHLPVHPLGGITDPYVTFHSVYAVESLFLPSDLEGEHFVHVRISLIVKSKGVNGSGE